MVTQAEKHPLQGRWISEAIFHKEDPNSGATIKQLTSQTTIATSIYCEDPYCSAKCGRVVVMRSQYTDNCAPWELWVIDLNKDRSVLIEDNISMEGIANHAYGDFFFYIRRSGSIFQLMRLCLSTLETKAVLTAPANQLDFISLGSMSPDNRFYVNKRRSGQNEIVVVDLETGEQTTIAKGKDISNPHPRFDRMKGEFVLIQWNRGQGWRDSIEEIYDARLVSLGVTLFLVRRDGTDRRELPIARPHIPTSVSGHEAWIKGEPAFIFSLRGKDSPYNDGSRVGNLALYRLGDDSPHVIAHDPDTYYGHVSTSYCGRYWVCDGWDLRLKGLYRPPWIAIGSIASGKFATLCKVEGNFPEFEAGHAHPYMTADNKWVIFGSTRAGIPQVFAAEVPEGFLEALD
jgi:hypothetical protein